MNPRNQYSMQGQRRPYPSNNNRNLGGLLLGGAVGYGLGYITPRPNYYQPYPIYGPYPVYPPFYPVGPYGRF